MEIKRNDRLETVSVYDFTDFSIGHEDDSKNLTGCSVIICNNFENLKSGVDVRGGAPGTRNIDIIAPVNGGEACQAVVLSGGSLYGLSASGGVERYLEERGIGTPFAGFTLPIVCQAIIFDLKVGSRHVRPDAEMGYEACEAAFKGIKYPDGNVGAGMGASLGKIAGPNQDMKGGIGTYCFKRGDLYVGAVVVVNAVGDVVNPETGELVAGLLDKNGTRLIDSEKYITENLTTEDFDYGNTTIGCIVTNAKLSKSQAHKIAAWSHNGIARSIRPSHTMYDGDTMFCMATGTVDASMMLVGTLAVQATERAILSAVRSADSLGGLKSYKDLKR